LDDAQEIERIRLCWHALQDLDVDRFRFVDTSSLMRLNGGIQFFLQAQNFRRLRRLCWWHFDLQRGV
jgi:hypothetical protein